jgi:hypothetical protein
MRKYTELMKRKRLQASVSNSGKLEADRMSDQTFGNRRRVQDLLKTSGTFIK